MKLNFSRQWGDSTGFISSRASLGSTFFPKVTMEVGSGIFFKAVTFKGPAG